MITLDPDFDYSPADYQETGICKNCGKSCTIVTIDDGIGPYEYGDERGVHKKEYKVSACCHADWSKF